jgi:hypothetical protein
MSTDNGKGKALDLCHESIILKIEIGTDTLVEIAFSS